MDAEVGVLFSPPAVAYVGVLLIVLFSRRNIADCTNPTRVGDRDLPADDAEPGVVSTLLVVVAAVGGVFGAGNETEVTLKDLLLWNPLPLTGDL